MSKDVNLASRCSSLRPRRLNSREPDITGIRFGRLTAVAPIALPLGHSVSDKSSRRLWLLDCDCGRFEYRTIASLRQSVRKGCRISCLECRYGRDNASRCTYDWSAAKLGVESDGEVARKIGCDVSTVRRRRERAGISPLNKGCGKSSVGRVDWDSEPLLGKISDGQLAMKLGVTDRAVGKARKARGIQACYPSGLTGVNWNEQPLGELSDRQLAGKLGVPTQYVQFARVRRGIPIYCHGKKVCYCGSEFEVKTSHQAYCSQACRAVADRHPGAPTVLLRVYKGILLVKREIKNVENDR